MRTDAPFVVDDRTASGRARHGLRARVSWVVWRALGALGLIGAATSLTEAAWHDSLGYDLNRIALRASDAFIHGHPLYLSKAQWEHLAPAPFTYVYPPFYAEILSPLLVVPGRALAVVAALGCLAAALGALWIVGVRDPRVFTITVCSYPVLWGSQVGNASLLLLPLLALAWKHRGPLPIAVALAIKPLLWFAIIWLWLSRGRAVAGRALLATVGLLAISWALIGFEGLLTYPRTLEWNDRNQAGYTYGLSSALPRGGIVAAAFAALALAAAWRRSRADDEGGVLTYCIFASLLVSPIVWMYTLTAMLVPLAVRRPSFSPVWLLLPVAWFAAHNSTSPLPGVTKAAVWLAAGGLAVWLGERRLGGDPADARERGVEPARRVEVLAET